MNALFSKGRLCQLEMTPEQTDFLWFLDQCGLDQHVRTLRHTDVFDRMRSLLMQGANKDSLRLEKNIHDNFLLDSWRLENQFGHAAVQRHYSICWIYEMNKEMLSNFINIKLRQLEAGSAPVLTLTELSLPASVKLVGSKKALLLMLTLPEGVLHRYQTWAQDLCFVDQLIEKKPDYNFLHKIREEYHKKFLSLYRSELRSANEKSGNRHGTDAVKTFYKKLFKYQYAVKRDIIRCLCEAGLNK